MAWIVKDRAHAHVERRADPYVTDAIKKHFEKDILPRYATRQAATLPLAHEIQHENGFIPEQAIEEMAAFLDLSFAEVLDTISFYEEFHLKPTGKYYIQICRSIACELCGYKQLSKKVQEKLDILPGETTDDGKWTLMELECLGACDHAPMALIDEKLHGPLTWEKLEQVIDNMPD
ncbi:MAG: NADH-quinone oxidoreductase subunit NuoE [Planctomycetes bacterium]|nr:NADH-quinone oxidoreductase subunit NuoE [Planctomycetota bacterium]